MAELASSRFLRLSLAGLRRLRRRPDLRDLRLLAGQQRAQLVEFVAQVVAGGDLADGQSQRGQFAGQELGVGLGLRGATAVLLQRDPVPVLLPVLRQQDQRRGVGGLGGEGQVEQDERIRVPAQLRPRPG